MYTDFSVDAEEAELAAWGAVADAYNDGGYCFYQAYSQWGYWEHSYEASVEIESPTMNTASDSDSLSDIPYGGGDAAASAVISVANDPGEYIIIWTLRIYCTVGGWIIDYILPLLPTVELVDITRYRNSANPSDEAPLTTTDVDADIHPYAIGILWDDTDGSGVDDVACRVIFLRKGPIATFEPFGDGDGDIDNGTEAATILGFPYLVSVVRNINWCDGASSPATVGCANTSGIFVERSSASYEGAFWAHEFGHYKGLYAEAHSTNEDSLFYAVIGADNRQVNQDDCDGLRQ